MYDSSHSIKEKLNYIDNLLSKLENNDRPTVYAILRNEIESLKRQVSDYKSNIKGKEVVGKEDTASKTRYYLKDGSVYVVKHREYKYLYDAGSKVVTYEFENGQIERTFENGLKEIRRKDGSIVIKSGPKEFDYIERVR